MAIFFNKSLMLLHNVLYLKDFFMKNERAEYVEILQKILTSNVPLSFFKDTIPDGQKSFFNMLFLTTFRQMTFIKQTVLPRFIQKKIPSKQKILNYIFYLSITELLFLDTPDYAVINSYVDIAKKFTDKFGANFVNAVLRNILRQKSDLLAAYQNSYFSAEFLKILKQDYSKDEIRQMEHFVSVEPALDITLKKSAKNPFSQGIILPTGSVRLEPNTKVSDLPAYNDGIWWVQDAAAALAVRSLENLLGKSVLDLCAAPGGKTAQLLDEGAKVTAVDISADRLNTLENNINRLNLSANLTVVCSDALNFNSSQKFDVILIDAPCSATGTFRRHPEIIHTKSLQDVIQQAELQKKILNHAVSLLAPKGEILYVTCSLAKLEGEKQINDFLKSHPDFEIKPISVSGTEKMRTKEGYLRILPQTLVVEGQSDLSGADGFFIAHLQRKI